MNRFIAVAALAVGMVLLPLNAWSQFQYVQRSRAIASEGSGFTEIAGGSESRILTKLREKVGPVARRGNLLVSDTYNIVLGKLEGGYTSPATLSFVTSDMYANLSQVSRSTLGLVRIGLDPNLITTALSDEARRNKNFYTGSFPRLKYVDFNPTRAYSGLNENQILQFVIDKRLQETHIKAEMIRSGADLSPFNHWITDRPTGANIDVVPLASQKNYLLFVPSDLGKPYYAGVRTHVAFYQTEPDLFEPESRMAAYGVFSLFEVVNPTPTVRLVIDVSHTLRSDGDSRLPRFDIIGDDHVVVTPRGSGSMRMISPPVHPHNLLGHYLIAIQSDATEYQFHPYRAGLMRIYGRTVPIDPRRIAGFARDFSAVSPDIDSQLHRPREIRHFPEDLLNDRSLEYSGLYEDGWTSKDVFVRLSRPPGAPLEIHGMVPFVDDQGFTTELTASVDDRVVARETLGTGDFSINAPVSGTCTTCDVTLHFSRTQKLPGGNPRPAVALLSSLGF